MDDGHLKIENNTPQKIILSTESFTTQENQWLINFLFQRYTLKFKLDGQNRIVLYDQFQIYYFLFLITPYLHNSMYRKIVPSCKLHHDTTARRTTIYLPRTIKIHSPTKEINAALRNLNQIINDYKQGLFYEKYNDTLTNQSSVNNKSYQIIITSKNLTDLIFLSAQTGLTYSRLTALCFEQEFL